MIHPAILREEDQARLGAAGAWRHQGNLKLQKLAKEYARTVGLPKIRETDPVTIDEDHCRSIAKAFDRLPFIDEDPFVKNAYEALADEIGLQFDLLSSEYSIEGYGDDGPIPYRNSLDMMEDVHKNKHLWVYTGGEDHAILSKDNNWKFRAVHDLFGHAAQGFSFGPRGEENAWIEHAKMLSPLARAALTTETRGQNQWVNCHPSHSKLSVKERPYAEQKAALLPEKYWTHPELERAYKDRPEFLYL